MTDTSIDNSSAAAAAPGDRRERFERDLGRIGHRTSRGDRKLALVGAVAMGVGILVALVAYIASTGQSDTRDVISSGILATVGLCVVVAGGAVFLRGSLTEFLRFWMLRILYEQQRSDEADG